MNLLASLLLLACATWSLTACATPTEPPSPSRPNIVFILADDMGYGDPTCNNPDSRIPTPHIDSLAGKGMRFTDAHAPGSFCIPSRYGLLTGRYPMRARLNWRHRAVIDAAHTTIASLLQRQGYATAMVGKWHLGFDGGPDFDWTEPMHGGPVDRGFDGYFGIPASLDIPPYYYIRNRRPEAPPTASIGPKNTDGWTKIQGEFWRRGKIAPGFVHEEVLPRLGDEAERYIAHRAAAKARDGKPFFLYVAFTAPHTPWLPLKKYRGKSVVDMYGDFVLQVDDTVGQILTALERHGFAEDTLVFSSSDNGPVWYPQDAQRFGHRSVGPLRGMKSDAWEGGHRVPFLARWPGRVRPGTVCDQTICFTDMLATFADITGQQLTPDESRDSASILSLLRGSDQPVRDVTILRANATVVRQRNWKLITHLGSGGFSKPRRIRPTPDGPKGQLYDLSCDLSETTNLWSQHPDIVRRLQAHLARARGSGR